MLPITFPATVGLGENTVGALNALVPVPTSGGGQRPYARGLLIRMSQFRIRGYGRHRILAIERMNGGR